MPDQVTPVSNSITLLSEMQGVVRLAAWPAHPGELVKSQINRSARRLGLTPRRAETLWYGRAGQILAEEADRLRAWRVDWTKQRRARLLAEMAAMDRVEEQLTLHLMLEERIGAP